MASAWVRQPSALLAPAGVALAGIAASATVMLAEPGAGAPYPACPSWTLAGVLCPFCGCLRGAHALMHGDVASMLSFNLLLPVVVVLAAWGWVRWASVTAGTSWSPPPLPRSRVFWFSFAAIALVYMVLRNVPWEPLSVLVP